MHKKLALRRLPQELGPRPNHLPPREPVPCRGHEPEQGLTWERTPPSQAPRYPGCSDLRATRGTKPRHPRSSAPQTSAGKQTEKLAREITDAIKRQNTTT